MVQLGERGVLLGLLLVSQRCIGRYFPFRASLLLGRAPLDMIALRLLYIFPI